MSYWLRSDNETLVCHAESLLETNEAGRSLAGRLQPGDVIALIGDLGAGKTQFVKGVAEGLDVATEEVNSPTFTLIQEYPGRILMRHCDTYRLRDAEEFADLGLDELFATDGVALIEWADRVEEYLPRDRVIVRITINSPTTRILEISATGNRSRATLAQLAATVL
ncbi:tRNA (adenosine(37)-N6)-threonylcarbamoyltransferase complex ATPase subunit type 1 TsaE [Schlesneria sp. DSM 10557]|uniref:tRNA (adenosine(37)-N6)-threonylcarbamoyltransferase complex ATPase subunit type 1 TsaE n=1 Tax=Schlesneria sp. DSM 10557 TaxID=3044399 RepID=UPI00359F6DF5